jgi:hypothetical protein
MNNTIKSVKNQEMLKNMGRELIIPCPKAQQKCAYAAIG